MALRDWLDRLSPDFFTTLSRFRFAVVLGLAGAILFIMQLNEALPPGDDTAMRALFGLWTGAALSTGGALFAESRPQARIAGIVLTYVVPIIAIGLFFIRDSTLFIPYLLPIIAVLWVSVSPTTVVGNTPVERQEQQNRFWWINHLAFASAAIAIVAFAIIALGTFAIERALDVLFGLDVGVFIYRWLLPFIGAFLAPFYWLATIPRPEAYDRRAVETPEFLGNAVGLIGQLLLAPLLFIYGAILLAYAVQIAVTQQLPEGMLGWMVLGFTVAGAATWLVLHPPFLRDRRLVRMFHRWWFWLTVIPIVLYAIAVGVRIDAYGLTEERMLLIGGGVWAALITIAFLVPRLGDIRLIPALAGVLLLVFSIGPWNIDEAPRVNQLARLDAALDAAFASGATPEWDPARRQVAIGAIDYLAGREGYHDRLGRLLAQHGFVASAPAPFTGQDLRAQLGIESLEPLARLRTLRRDVRSQLVDVGATPRMLGTFHLTQNEGEERLGLIMSLEGNVLKLRPANPAPGGPLPQGADLGVWVATQPEDRLSYPAIDFTFGGLNFRIAVDEVMVRDLPPPDGGSVIVSLAGVLFTNAVAATP